MSTTTGSHEISPYQLGDLLNSESYRTLKTLVCNSELSECPNCQKSLSKRSEYTRSIDFLQEKIYFIVAYYYCDNCKLGWPSIPYNSLPNLTVGIDVLGHLAYYHILGRQSYESLSEHLRTCHGINRSPKAIETYIERFHILIEDALELFQTAIRTYLATQKVKVSIFDEAFLSSRYPEKLCMAMFILPEVHVIAGINMSREHNKEQLERAAQIFYEKLGQLDVLIIDLAPYYKSVFSKVFTGISIQFCVFHFFQLIHRNVIRPEAQKIRHDWYDSIKDLRQNMKSTIKRIQKNCQMDEREILENLQKRLFWCLKRKFPTYIQMEVKEFRQQLEQLVTKTSWETSLEGKDQQCSRSFYYGLKQLISIIKGWEDIVCKTPGLENFSLLQQTVNELVQIFQETDEKSFENKYEQIVNYCKSRSNELFDLLVKYLTKYRENLATFLEYGIQKATSLIEGTFQQFKKTTKNFQGGHDVVHSQAYADLYRFFKNVSPIRLRNERSQDARSPFTRMAEQMSKPSPINLTLPWWEWLRPMNYHTYRIRVKELREKKRTEWKEITRTRRNKAFNPDQTRKERAKQRWKQSKTLATVSDILTGKNKSSSDTSLSPVPLESLSSTDRTVLDIISQFEEGISRPLLCQLLSLPRTTVYDSLKRLMVDNLISTYSFRHGGVGRPITMFEVINYDPG